MAGGSLLFNLPRTNSPIAFASCSLANRILRGVPGTNSCLIVNLPGVYIS